MRTGPTSDSLTLASTCRSVSGPEQSEIAWESESWRPRSGRHQRCAEPRSIDRRDNVGVAEINRGRVQRRLLLLDIRPVEFDLRSRLVGGTAGAVDRVL